MTRKFWFVAVSSVAFVALAGCGEERGGGSPVTLDAEVDDAGGADAGRDVTAQDSSLLTDLGPDPDAQADGSVDEDAPIDTGGGDDVFGEDVHADAQVDVNIIDSDLERIEPADGSFAFPATPIGTLNPTPLTLRVRNSGTTSISGVHFSGLDPHAFPFSNEGVGNCVETGSTGVDDPLAPWELAPGADCTQVVYFWPRGGTVGTRSAAIDVEWSDGSMTVVTVSGQATDEVAVDGIVASPTGSGGACTLAEPCSLTSARDLARASSGNLQADLSVTLRGGTYILGATFELGPDDSGSNGHSVVYRAYPGETPILSGGTVISGWTLSDPGHGIYRAPVPASLNTRQLYVDGRRARRARGPFEPDGYSVITHGYSGPDASMATWRNVGDIELVDFKLWKSFRCTVDTITGNTINMVEPCWSLAQWHTNLGMEAPTWIENAYELLDEPGEWYHDRQEHAIYAIPTEGHDLSSSHVVAAALETVMAVRGTLDSPVHDLRFEGLTFSHGTWMRPGTAEGYPVLQAGYLLTGDLGAPTFTKTAGNVVLSRAESIVFEGDTFEHLGATALVVEHGSRGNTFVGNVFRDISAGAINLGDIDSPNATDPRQITADNTIANNLVTDCGREYYDAPGILVGYAQRTTIAHNEIFNLPYTGISVGWGWSLNPTVAQGTHITANRISGTMERLFDGGSIYILGSQPDSTIESNFVHNQINEYAGIYLDQGSEFFTVSDNVLSSVPNWYLLQTSVPPFVQNNSVTGNLTDTSDAMCCWGDDCCTALNDVSGNSVVNGAWPAEARLTMQHAGLESAYQDLLDGPRRVEAEDYNHGGFGVGYSDITFWDNAGGAYRDDSVDLYAMAGCSNDHYLGDTVDEEWTAYLIDAPVSGPFEFGFAAASQGGASIEVRVDGTSAGSVTLPNTGGMRRFDHAALGGISMSAGVHEVRLKFTGSLSLDYFTFEATR